MRRGQPRTEHEAWLAAEAPLLMSDSLELLGRVSRLDDFDAAERLFSDAVVQAELGSSPLRRVPVFTSSPAST